MIKYSVVKIKLVGQDCELFFYDKSLGDITLIIEEFETIPYLDIEFVTLYK